MSFVRLVGETRDGRLSFLGLCRGLFRFLAETRPDLFPHHPTLLPARITTIYARIWYYIVVGMSIAMVNLFSSHSQRFLGEYEG